MHVPDLSGEEFEEATGGAGTGGGNQGAGVGRLRNRHQMIPDALKEAAAESSSDPGAKRPLEWLREHEGCQVG